jgi:hypothetical protein
MARTKPVFAPNPTSFSKTRECDNQYSVFKEVSRCSAVRVSAGKRVRPIFFTRSREAAKKEKQKNSGREQLLATQLPGNAFDLLPLLRILA